MGGKVYYRHAERHKANDAIAALLDADLRSPNIPESRSVHHDALGDEFRGVEPSLVERSGFQILQVVLNPSIHFGVAGLFVIGDDAPDAECRP